MVRRLQPIDSRRFGIRQPSPLGAGLHIPRQQHPLALCLDHQHTGAVIAALPVRPAPERKAHAVPCPSLATGARLQLNVGQRFATNGPPDRQASVDGRSATGMVGMSMTDQHHIQLPHTQFMQGRQHHTLAQVTVTPRRACVVEQAVMTRAQQYRQALTNVQLPDLDLPMRYRIPRQPKGQQHDPAKAAKRHTTRQQQQQSPGTHH